MVPIPEGLPPAHAACCEPLACVLYALDQVTLSPGDEVALLGSGALGLLFLQELRRRGNRVLVVGRSQTKLAQARRFGAEVALSIQEVKDPVAEIRSLSNGGKGVDLAIEAVGQPHIWEQALRMTRKGGQVLLFGGCPQGTTITVDTGRLHYEEQKLIGVFHHTPSHIRAALERLSHGMISVTPLLSRTLPLHRLGEALEEMRRGLAFKIVIDPFLKDEAPTR
ncbi:MAG: hypothetical protein D6736_00555 [Nitrospinota bacterium]|nr:MAG: hypothetical protein D6736_00555 [Nitrospinota bacterium]